MSGLDEEFAVQLDANIEVETTIRNKFAEVEVKMVEHSITVDRRCLLPDSDQDSFANCSTISDQDDAASPSSNVSDINSDCSTDSNIIRSIHAEVTGQKEETTSAQANCKELIVFCIDMSSDMEKLRYTVNSQEHTALTMVKRAIGMFVHHKNCIDKRHKYSVMILYDSACWVCAFTNDLKNLIEYLDDLTETLDCSSCDLSSVMTLLAKKCPPFFPDQVNPSEQISCILRVILIYGRSNCMIEFSDPKAKDMISDYPAFFLDVIYLHETDTENTKITEIYDSLCSLDKNDKSYVFETGKSVTALSIIMGKLLSHPLQRPSTKVANYRLKDYVPDMQESS